MSEVLIKIGMDVPTYIFNVPKIKRRVNTLFNEMEDDIKARFDEIYNFIIEHRKDSKEEYKFSYDEIVASFKLYFYKVIIHEAIKIVFIADGRYDMVDNILKLLSKENLKKAILGDPMISAFEDALKDLPSGTGFSKSLHGSMMLLLQAKFLGNC